MRRLIAGAEKPYPARKRLFEQVGSLSPEASINPVYFLHGLFSGMFETYASTARHEASGRADQEVVTAGGAPPAFKTRHPPVSRRLPGPLPASGASRKVPPALAAATSRRPPRAVGG